MRKRLLQCVADGLTLKQAAIANGIGETTLQYWKHQHPELVPLLEEAREKARQNALATILEASGDDWRAAESFLKYSFWQDYRNGPQVNVSSSMITQTAVVSSEEDRERLIKLRESITGERITARQTKHAEVVETFPGNGQEENSGQPSR